LAPLSAHLLDYGIVEPVGPQQKVVDETSATGFRYHGDSRITSHTAVVLGKQGVAFGISFRIDGVPRFTPVQIAQVIRHPPMKLPDGSVIQEQISYQPVRSREGSVLGKLFYTLREPHEVVPGNWSISIMDGNRLLLEQKFVLQPPPK